MIDGGSGGTGLPLDHKAPLKPICRPLLGDQMFRHGGSRRPRGRLCCTISKISTRPSYRQTDVTAARRNKHPDLERQVGFSLSPLVKPFLPAFSGKSRCFDSLNLGRQAHRVQAQRRPRDRTDPLSVRQCHGIPLLTGENAPVPRVFLPLSLDSRQRARVAELPLLITQCRDIITSLRRSSNRRDEDFRHTGTDHALYI